MTIPVTICDDSNLARKQMARALPPEWDVSITFAKHGQEGIEAIENGLGEVLFLDLTMPVKDGYEVLEHIREHDLNTMVIVVSGDVQPTARERVKSLGALEFIKKPIKGDQIAMILEEFGLLTELKEPADTSSAPAAQPSAPPVAPAVKQFEDSSAPISLKDSYQEIANVAMGQAAALLATVLDAFVVLPIPSVNNIELSELRMALQFAGRAKTVSAVCQGFIGNCIAGEALIIFNDSSFTDIAKLMKYEGELDESIELELIMDIASILVGAFLKAFAKQLDIQFQQGHPRVLGQHCNIADLIKPENSTWKETLAIEITYTLEKYNVDCDLLILFTEDSINELNSRVSYYSS
ncbi:response regulator [Pleionea sp. CnH1-48]|uniref:response regulator n=1 Tax=Pleionea sp. CnH1-48 TaxID=2954494 RepID=UPI002096FE03|nr:response regulator [Pleionea sp. CnH1-48]MCO7227179.1 response regulator [Pleionea sp. CnH1-48]